VLNQKELGWTNISAQPDPLACCIINFIVGRMINVPVEITVAH
jgi:hypothetical protein